MNLTAADKLLILTLVLIAAAMFTKQPFLDDSAKIVLGYLLKTFYDTEKPGS